MESRPPKSVGASERGQFVHVEYYARATPHSKQDGRSIFDVANEAVRAPENCGHIASPLPPKSHFGVSPLLAAKLSEDWSRAQFTPYLHKRSGETKLRRIRPDQACALVGVVSAPPEFEQGSKWTAFIARTIAWLRKKYGRRLKSVIEHTDEPQLHLHFWVVPEHGERFSEVHQGLRAMEELPRKARRTRRVAAFSAAMSRYQDEFFEAVAGAFGFKRTTVGGRRLRPAQFDALKARKAAETAAFERGTAQAADEKTALQRRIVHLERRNAELELQVAQDKAEAMFAAMRPQEPQAPATPSHSEPIRPMLTVVAPVTQPPVFTASVRPSNHATPHDDLRRPHPPRPR